MTARQKSAVLVFIAVGTFVMMFASVILTSPSPFSAYIAGLEKQVSAEHNTQETEQKITSETTVLKISGKVNVNEATPEELLAIKGMTENVVVQIMTHRESYRRFDSFQDLNDLIGVTDGMIALWKDVIIFE